MPRNKPSNPFFSALSFFPTGIVCSTPHKKPIKQPTNVQITASDTVFHMPVR